MRTKFRAWMKQFKKMDNDIGEMHFEDGEFKYIGDDVHYKRLPEDIILMQSTGLFDKNGKEIFEGDIIANGPDVMCMKRHNTLGFYVEKKGRVEFIADGAVLEEFEEDAKEIADSLEIIGNIYENPELLEDGK